MTSSAPSSRRFEFASRNLDLDRLARPALVVAVVVSGLLIFHLTRGSSFSADDWSWIEGRRGNSVHTFLAPYNGHLSLVPIAIYRVMFALVGIRDFVAYRILLLVVASATGVVIFEYVRHRVDGFCALLVAMLLMFLGPGWNDIMQPFQIAWLIAVASGLLALSLLDCRRARTDAAACALTLISLSSTSVGVALAVGIAVDVAIARRRWRDAWIVGLPLLLYAAWALHYHPTEIQMSSITSAPPNLVRATAAAVAGTIGLSGVTPLDANGQALTFGVSLLVLAVAAVLVRAGTGWDWTRFLSLGVALVTFSLMTTLARSFQSPLSSRYIYVSCVLSTLMAVEVVRGLSVALRAQLVVAALTLAAVIANIGVLRTGGTYFRQLGERTDATLGAVELDRDRVAASTPLTQLPYYPLAVVTAGQYFRAERDLGTPAYTVAQLQHSNPAVQGAADAQLLTDRQVELAPVSTVPSPRGIAPGLEGAVNGSIARHGACVEFMPTAAQAPGETSRLALALNPGRVSVTAGAAPTAIAVRRFAPTFTALGTVQTRGSAIVSVSGDRAPQGWHLQVQSAASVHLCMLGAT